MASLSRRKIKEGYLVKKFGLWFVLYDEKLCYFKKKEETDPAGWVDLLGCFIVSPCTEYTKKEGVFRLTSAVGTEYLIQAANDEERDSWANSIANAIRDSEAKHRKANAVKENSQHSSQPLVSISTSRLLEIVNAMQDPGAGVTLGSHSCAREEKIYKLCFTGTQVVDWLLKWSFVSDRTDGFHLANALLDEAYLQPTGRTSKASFRRGKSEGGVRAFLDNNDALYRFSALRYSSNQDALDLDSSDDSTDSDDEPVREPVGVIKGTVVKEGFLEKKGHLRHNWKTRKFILCSDPPALYYCKPSKGNLPVGKLKLDSCEVKAINKDDEIANSLQNGAGGSDPKKTAYLIKLRTRKGAKFVMKAASESDRREWLENLQTVCEDSMVE
ncbi:pleckstrin-2 [Nematostella vectensis]|uniref:pleckstrin-2 n=1 Tax=Nematostella vectensis TaxID=45351 RepID=UPI00207767CC|nr:pleckstrin-2 [Nematostella vectensis]